MSHAKFQMYQEQLKMSCNCSVGDKNPFLFFYSIQPWGIYKFKGRFTGTLQTCKTHFLYSSNIIKNIAVNDSIFGEIAKLTKNLIK